MRAVNSTFFFLGLIALAGLMPCFVSGSSAAGGDAWERDADGNLVIHADSVAGDALFIPCRSGGTPMEIIVARADDGQIRVAFNTCQVCAGSPRAYFVLDGRGFVCRNCGNVFSAAQVGASGGGCNPLPVPGVETAKPEIVIPAAVLAAHEAYFRNWKRGE